MTTPPRPYLSREETNEILNALGFEFDLNWQLKDSLVQRTKMADLQTLIAGAIAEWVGIELPTANDPGDGEPEDVVAELQEWTEEWLVG